MSALTIDSQGIQMGFQREVPHLKLKELIVDSVQNARAHNVKLGHEMARMKRPCTWPLRPVDGKVLCRSIEGCGMAYANQLCDVFVLHHTGKVETTGTQASAETLACFKALSLRF